MNKLSTISLPVTAPPEDMKKTVKVNDLTLQEVPDMDPSVYSVLVAFLSFRRPNLIWRIKNSK